MQILPSQIAVLSCSNQCLLWKHLSSKVSPTKSQGKHRKGQQHKPKPRGQGRVGIAAHSLHLPQKSTACSRDGTSLNYVRNILIFKGL